MTDYFVDPLNGSDAAAGTTFGTAWATTQKAADTLVGGDRAFLSNTAIETPLARTDWDTNAGSDSAPIEFIGADNLGVALTTGYYVLSGSSLPATTDLTIFNLTNQFIRFTRVRFTAATRDNVTFGTNAHFINFNNCRIDNAASDGLFSTTTNGHVWLISCSVHNNVSQGINVNAAGRLNCTLLDCDIFDNGSIGAEIGGDANSVTIDYCRVYGNGADGLQMLSEGAKVLNCTVYDNVGDGVFINESRQSFYNITSTNNGGFGFNISTVGDDFLDFDHNHTFNNTSGASNITLIGDNNQTGDPDFADAGNADFTPSATSPLADNGLSGVDIGARKAASGGGGGDPFPSQGIQSLGTGLAT